jgi:hypothetical protein
LSKKDVKKDQIISEINSSKGGNKSKSQMKETPNIEPKDIKSHESKDMKQKVLQMEQLLNKSYTKKDEKPIKDEKQNEMIEENNEETNDRNSMKQRIANALNKSKTSPKAKEKITKKDTKNKKNGETFKANIEKFDKLLNKQNKKLETEKKPKLMKELAKEMEMKFKPKEVKEKPNETKEKPKENEMKNRISDKKVSALQEKEKIVSTQSNIDNKVKELLANTEDNKSKTGQTPKTSTMDHNQKVEDLLKEL